MKKAESSCQRDSILKPVHTKKRIVIHSIETIAIFHYQYSKITVEQNLTKIKLCEMKQLVTHF